MAQIAAPGINPNPPVIYENPNCMNRIVQWFRNEETSTLMKVGVLVLAAIVLIGLGFLAGQPILVPLLATLPFALWAGREWHILNENEIQRTALEVKEAVEAMERVEASLASNFEKMKGAVGGETAFDGLPVLELNHEYKDYIDWLKPEDLPFSVMKGVFITRQFISIKLKDAEQDGKVFVITFHERGNAIYAIYRDSWTHGASGTFFKNPFFGPLRPKDRILIHQIVVLKNHPRFTLVE